jgi:DNA-binding NarL/FixJ family response regulator
MATANVNGAQRAKADPSAAGRSASSQRAALAEFCRVWQRRFDPDAPQTGDAAQSPSMPSPVPGDAPALPMAPRLRQTLELLLAGDSEKQIAGKLKLSPHTIHDYVKSVYRRFNVCTRAELLALWVRR